MENPLKPPTRYQYARFPNENGTSIYAVNKQGMPMGIERVTSIDVPFMPHFLLKGVQEIRLRRGEMRAATKADRRTEQWGHIWKVSPIRRT